MKATCLAHRKFEVEKEKLDFLTKLRIRELILMGLDAKLGELGR